MLVTLKLFATLGDWLPAQVNGHARTGNEFPLELPEGTAVQAVIDRFKLPVDMVHLVLVNGTYVPAAERGGLVLREGDALAIWPPIAGG